MPVFDIDPGQSPEAPGTLSFFRQGQDPTTGFQVTADGALTAPGGQSVGGSLAVGDDLTVTDQLTVGGFTSLASAQTSGDFTSFGGNGITVGSAGAGLRIKEGGAGGRQGAATLVAGTVTVACTAVTANSRIQLTAQNSGAAPGALRVSARTPGASFVITSTSGTDTSLVAYQVFEPAP